QGVQVVAETVPADQVVVTAAPAAVDSNQIFIFQYTVSTRGRIGFDPASLFELVKNYTRNKNISQV
ncbi:MAG TPA: hypothetical protein PLA74_09055, partial [Syntrophales bacterium]|nr:hypothetical protein [Syntrophales bacterium]